jgi:hypothetical protein
MTAQPQSLIERETPERESVALTPAEQMASTVQALAMNPDVDVDKLERIIKLQREMVAEQARQSFAIAMTAAQRAMGPIVAKGWNPETRSKYRKYEDIDRVIRPIYTDHGFAMSFGTEITDKPEEVRVTCVVSHVAGHERAYAVNVPSDGKGIKGGTFMTRTHATGSGLTYGKRYLADLIWNLAMTEDDDGNQAASAAPKPKAPEGYATFLESLDDAAAEGGEALKLAWKDAAKPLREYLSAHDPQRQKGYRAKADLVDKAKAKQTKGGTT